MALRVTATNPASRPGFAAVSPATASPGGVPASIRFNAARFSGVPSAAGKFGKRWPVTRVLRLETKKLLQRQGAVRARGDHRRQRGRQHRPPLIGLRPCSDMRRQATALTFKHQWVCTIRHCDEHRETADCAAADAFRQRPCGSNGPPCPRPKRPDPDGHEAPELPRCVPSFRQDAPENCEVQGLERGTKRRRIGRQVVRRSG